MKNLKYAIWTGAALLSAAMGMGTVMTAKAVNYNYVTITVDAVDDSGSLQYAIDSDAPEAFSDKSSFEVVPGSTHTIYVKDIAGNVTSQIYSIPEQDDKGESEPARPPETIKADASVSESYDPDTNERKVDIDVNLANGAFTGSGTAEDGGGTLYDKEKTDGTDASGKIFYTVTTKEGEVFYLVVDQHRNDNNVYLLTQATVNDLQHLADQNDYDFTISGTGQNSQSLLNMLSGNNSQGTEMNQQPGEQSAPAKSGTSSNLLLVGLVAIAGGGYYFFRMKKNRREKQMDEIDSANNLEDYEIDETAEDEDELEFDEAPSDQEHGYQDDEELKRLMELNTDAVFGEAGEIEAVPENGEASPSAAEMGLEDYDEFGEENV